MILVVDDDANVRQFVRLALEDAGYSVTAAASADEAWRILQQSPPDLLLTDIVMPGANGLVLAARAHKLKPDLHVIFMTGFAQEYHDELSGSVCLSKPFSIATLLSAVESAIGHPHQTPSAGGA
jgi:two-component system cell cycle response regulator CpdR